MPDSIRNLDEWYPLLPAEAGIKPAWVSNILDIRLVVTLAAGNDVESLDGFNQDMLRVYFTGLSESTASFQIQSTADLQGASTASVPVYVGKDTIPAVSSYIVLKEPTEQVSTRIEVHPDCLLVRQVAPSLLFHTRTGISQKDSRETPAGYVSEQPARYTKFKNGHNVTVGYNAGALSFACKEGIGLGIYQDPPYIYPDPYYPGLPPASYTAEMSRGLRSINGLTGGVGINGGVYVVVETLKGTDKLSLVVEAVI